MRRCSYSFGLIVLVMFGKHPNITRTINPKLYYPSHEIITNQSLANLCLFCLIVTGIDDTEANKHFLTLFLIFSKIRQNVNNNQSPQYCGVTTVL